MRYAARVDDQHGAIRDGLRDAGVAVLDQSKAGAGSPDLLCWTQWTGFLPLEVKTKRGKRLRSLTIAQVAAKSRMPIAVVDSLEAALALFGLGSARSSG